MTPACLPGRMAEHVEVDENGHWIWTGALSNKGYGQVSVSGKTRSTHRVAYLALVGPIPPRMEIDHKCRIKACTRPACLEVVTSAENKRRARLAARATYGQTCPAGHELAGANRYDHPRGQVVCRACRAAYQRTRRAVAA